MPSNLKKSSFLPRIAKGAVSPFFVPSIFAPIPINGLPTLAIGRLFKYLSPLRTKKPSLAAKNPIKSRIAVPELPHSKTTFGSDKICGGTITISLPLSQILAPSNCTILSVFSVSSALK